MCLPGLTPSASSPLGQSKSHRVPYPKIVAGNGTTPPLTLLGDRARRFLRKLPLVSIQDRRSVRRKGEIMEGERRGEPVGHEQGKRYLKYGGVRFSNNVPPQEINEFVRQLPASERESLFEVVHRLEQEGLITIHHGDQTTIDDEMQPYLETDEDAKPGRGGPENIYPLDVLHHADE